MNRQDINKCIEPLKLKLGALVLYIPFLWFNAVLASI